jgi:E3 ubiquitin-protein ligase DOA10
MATPPDEAVGTSQLAANDEPVCRICHEGVGRPLLQPCRCAGTGGYVHGDCISRWVTMRARASSGPEHAAALLCEVCTAPLPLRVVRPSPLRFLSFARLVHFMYMA